MRLKPGPGHLPEEVRASQRARIHRAMIELVADRGLAAVTVRGLSRTSGVSTRTFYAHFTNAEECFASAYRSILRRAAERLADATRASRGEDGLRAAVRALMDSAAENPKAASLALVDCYDGGPAMLREIATATNDLERQLLDGLAPLPLQHAQAIVASVERIVRTRLLEDRAADLPQLADQLADWILGIYELSCTRKPTSSVRHPRLPPRPSSTRKDPGFVAFEAVDGDRGRVLAAVTKLSVGGGYWTLTLPVIRREAGVSRRRFDALFDGIDQCYLEAIDILATTAAGAAVRGAAATSGWQSRVEETAFNFCEEVIRSPVLAQLCFVDIFAPGRPGLRARERLIATAAGWLQTTAPARHRSVELAAEASMAASWRLIQVELTTSEMRPRMDALLGVGHLLLSSPEARAGTDRTQLQRRSPG